MEFHGIEIVCPACGGELLETGASLRCRGCERTYPVIAGIPDLRLWPDPYIGIDEDRAKGEKLAAACEGLGFEASVELYYRLTTVVPPFQAKVFTRGLLAAADRAAASLASWERACPATTDGLRLLELGCGTAPLLVDAAPRYATVAGIDVAFRWLVVARKRLEEAGIEVPLLCACAEALPFPDAMFDRVVADSAFETFRDLPAAATQAARVGAPGACLFVATPNRFSLGPDPHVGVPAGGWLPKAVLDRIVRAKGAIPPVRTLLSAGSLRRLLRDAGFEQVRVEAPSIPEAVRARLSATLRVATGAYNAVASVPPGRTLLRAVGPLLHAVARKPANAGVSAARAVGRR